MILNMSRLEFFERGFGFDAAKLGVMPVGYLVKFDVYKTYLDFRDKALESYKPREAIARARSQTVEKTKLHYSYVCRAILWFEDDFAKTGKPKTD